MIFEHPKYTNSCPLCNTTYIDYKSHESSIGHRSMVKTMKTYIKQVNAPGRDEIIRQLDNLADLK